MSKGINGSAQRKCPSFIDAFVEHTSKLEAPELFRKWIGIGVIAAALEQKVWIETTSCLYPNMYVFIVGHPGTGKTRTIHAAGGFLRELTELHIAPTSMTMASLVDCLLESKRTIIKMPNPPMEFNSMTIVADELGAFMHKFEEELIGGLTTFYDVIIPYSQHRRGKDIKIKIKRPQLNIIAGTTPSNLIKFVPDFAWDQGFTSRVMLVFSDNRPPPEDMFGDNSLEMPKEMVHDLKVINSLVGRFVISDEYRTAYNNWRKLGEPEVPTHPKLIHYCTRRRVHLLKLSMVASIDRGDNLSLSVADFNRSMGWLLEAEAHMPDIFSAGTTGADGKAIDEILHFIRANTGKTGISEHRIVNFARERLPIHAVMRVIEVMEKSGMIHAQSQDSRTGLRSFKAS
jgi:hypothetical protein